MFMAWKLRLLLRDTMLVYLDKWRSWLHTKQQAQECKRYNAELDRQCFEEVRKAEEKRQEERGVCHFRERPSRQELMAFQDYVDNIP